MIGSHEFELRTFVFSLKGLFSYSRNQFSTSEISIEGDLPAPRLDFLSSHSQTAGEDWHWTSTPWLEHGSWGLWTEFCRQHLWIPIGKSVQRRQNAAHWNFLSLLPLLVDSSPLFIHFVALHLIISYIHVPKRNWLSIL